MMRKHQAGNFLDAFSAAKFVDDLLKDGSKVPCDNTIEEFEVNDIPKFYDAKKYKAGQNFYHKHVFALFFSKFLGLIVTLSSASILAVLIMTKMSSSPMTAYRRYVATIFHVNLWYEHELTPDSKAMKSLRRIKSFHNSASMRSRKIERPPITQTDMVLTQFGFMGFGIARTEMIGVYGATKEELEGYIHFWRVIGSIMGIQDRFNMCRDSLEETREICEELINRVYRPYVAKKDKDFVEMTSYLTDGLWYTNPMLNYRVFVSFMYDMLQPKECLNNNHESYFDLGFFERWYYKILYGLMYSLKYDICRLYHNFHHHLRMWIIHWYPFLAVFKFGYKNAMVSIDINNVKTHAN
ncbi:uncharacterized protein LOC123688876 isoform X2 [Harmonia axyridis]|uniref:uncharacterized protein LOC123688876 isoform X2 n=1 Tax=Harmonia axyridis TaxID=115357 RepID=UPI001E279851|nr:uncharacterized protein LOC123688876 isoform X2 [Harmonia axyridis]XP_045483558.1 uncharacterized protein LOC123688876 isoform X2 [Harmonia axyridis]